MKALSVRQPWAWAIIHAGKPVENRTWKTKIRGEILIHASKTFDHEGYYWIKENCRELSIGPFDIPKPNDFLKGGMIGIATLVSCVQSHPNPWFFGPYGFVFEDPRPIDFIPCPGKLGFFDFNRIIEIANFDGGIS